MYEYTATVVSVHDGDTATFDIDLGFRVHVTSSLRFTGINAPELSTVEGKAARDYLLSIMPVGTNVFVKTLKAHEYDKYGRYLGTVSDLIGTRPYNQQMIDSGHAVFWDGTGTKPV